MFVVIEVRRNAFLHIKLRGVFIMLKMKQVTDTYDMQVFTDNGDYFGDIEETILTHTKIFGWKVRATKNSFLMSLLNMDFKPFITKPLKTSYFWIKHGK